MSWIPVHSRGRFRPFQPRAGDVRITDIAHALSQKCRFTGHTDAFWSVGQHSLEVARLLPPRHRIWGLLHDAAEAYLPDIARPIKPHVMFETSPGRYEPMHRVEGRILDALGDRYGLPPRAELWPVVKHADDVLAVTEARDLMGVAGDLNDVWPRDDGAPWPAPLARRLRPRPMARVQADFLRVWATRTQGDSDEDMERSAP